MNAELEHYEIDDSSMPVLNDASTQTDHYDDRVSILSLSKPDLVTAQINEAGPLPPARPYHCYRRSMKTGIRSEIMERFHNLLNTYVHGDAEALSDLVDALLKSKKWTSLFRISRQKEDKNVTSRLRSSLVNEYHECKTKESNHVIQKQTQKLQQTIKISATKTNSYIAFQDVTPEASKVRIDAVNSLGRLTTYSA